MKKLLLVCFALGLLTTVSFAGDNELTEAEKKAGFKLLFDGKTLDGWNQKNGKAKFEVVDGQIVGTTVKGSPNSFLCTNEDYANFELHYEFLVDNRLNSGVQIRSQSLKKHRKGRVHGYQCEIDPGNRAWTAGIYDEGRRGWLFPSKKNKEQCAAFSKAGKVFKNEDWNKVKIICDGDSIKTWLNGVERADLKDSMTAKGFIGLQVHSHKTAGLSVKWKNIKIRVLPKQAKPEGQ